MSRLLRGAVLVAILASCGPRETRALSAAVASPLESGEELYRRTCASCHGPGGRGNGRVARSLRVPPSDLTLLAERHGGVYPRELVMATITGERPVDAHGDRDMPVWSQRFGPVDASVTAGAAFYARRRVEVLADYVESLGQRER